MVVVWAVVLVMVVVMLGVMVLVVVIVISGGKGCWWGMSVFGCGCCWLWWLAVAGRKS